MGNFKIVFLLFLLFFVSCNKKNEPFYDYNIEEKITSLGYTLPEPNTPVANYVSTVSFAKNKHSKLVYVSGTGPKTKDGVYITGKLGKDLTIEDGYFAAQITGLNILAALKKEVGDLNNIKRFVKVIGMVNSTPDFEQQPAVINGFSDFIVEVFGERGKHARSAVGMVSLPSGIAVEIEVIVEVKN
jgi:enamine deaminase RidA (YjgF/YER057c/UK114 family)|tara:strand:+ start:171 stop:728 length:558 start_codon:yes stop_codon:yes gene_type:complete